MKDGNVNTHETDAICIGVLLDVLHQIPTRYPFRNELERGRSDTKEGDNVSMFQAFPEYSFPIEGL